MEHALELCRYLGAALRFEEEEHMGVGEGSRRVKVRSASVQGSTL